MWRVFKSLFKWAVWIPFSIVVLVLYLPFKYGSSYFIAFGVIFLLILICGAYAGWKEPIKK